MLCFLQILQLDQGILQDLRHMLFKIFLGRIGGTAAASEFIQNRADLCELLNRIPFSSQVQIIPLVDRILVEYIFTVIVIADQLRCLQDTLQIPEFV